MPWPRLKRIVCGFAERSRFGIAKPSGLGIAATTHGSSGGVQGFAGGFPGWLPAGDYGTVDAGETKADVLKKR